MDLEQRVERLEEEMRHERAMRRLRDDSLRKDFGTHGVEHNRDGMKHIENMLEETLAAAKAILAEAKATQAMIKLLIESKKL